MSRYTYEDGSLCVVVETGMPEHNVEIGIGDTWHEAIDSLQTTAIQSTGRDGGRDAAIRWAHGAGLISGPTLEEVDVDLDAELSGAQHDEIVQID